MRTFSKAAAAAAAATLVLGLTSCASDAGAGGGEDPFSVVAFTPGYSTPVAKGTLDTFVEQAEQRGWKVTVVTSDFDYDKLNNEVTAAVTQGADALFSGLSDFRQMSPILNAAKDAEIPIFSVDGGVEPNENFALDVTTDQDQIGELGVQALEEELGGLKGKQILMIGYDYHPGIKQRAAKAHELFEKAGTEIAGGEIKQVLNPGHSHEEALKFVTDYLQANPDELDGVWTGWDHAAVGAAQAISEAGEDIPVTGVDAIGIALDGIKKDGPLHATVLQPWPEVLQIAIDEMEAYAADGELPENNFVEVGVTLVDASNVDKFKPTDQ